MRILIDARPLLEPHPTGVTVYARALMDALFAIDRQNEYYVFINCFRDAVAARLPRWTYPNVHMVRTRIPNKLFHSAIALFRRPRLDRLVEKRIDAAIDAVVSFNPHFLALSRDVPFFLTIHDLSHTIDPHFFRPYDRLWHRMVGVKRLIARANGIFAVSQNTAQDIEQLYTVAPERIQLLSPGAPTVSPRCASSVCPNDAPHPRIIFIGTRERRKNVLGAIRAFAQVAVNHPQAELVLVGGCGYAWHEAEEVLRTLPMRDRIRVVGYTSESDKWELLRHATVCVYPSFYEGFGLPILEALAVGVPVVTSIGSSLPEAGGAAALYCNPWRPDMIAHAIDLLLTDPSLREKLQQAGQEHVAQFSWEKSAHRLLQTLTDYAHRH